MTDHAPARLTEHRSAHQVCFEELISRNADDCELVAIAWSDGIQHSKALAVQHAALAYADSCAKVAERLEVVLQVPAAFIEKVVIDGAFLINRNQLPELALADFVPFRRNFHDRSAVHFEGVVHSIGLRSVGASCRHLSEKPVLFAILCANALKGTRQTGRHHSVSCAKFRNLFNLILRIPSVPFHDDLPDDGTHAWHNMKREVNLVLVLYPMLSDTNLRAVKSVFIEYPLYLCPRPLEFIGRIEFSQLQPAPRDQLIRRRTT